jgi:hypothetical protein
MLTVAAVLTALSSAAVFAAATVLFVVHDVFLLQSYYHYKITY